MPRIRKLEIHNFRGIKSLWWFPAPGINCLVGPGDSGKSTILDAIDLCLGARRTMQFTDSDFFALSVADAISISITIGALDDELKNMELYGSFLRGFIAEHRELTDEPEAGAETVLTLNLTVNADLEPIWTIVSDRASAQGITRNLLWADRLRVVPTSIGALAEQHLAWRRGSILNRISENGPDATQALLNAVREARAAFGDEASKELNETLKVVDETASHLGVVLNGSAKAMLDAGSVAFGSGTVALHNGAGVPLHNLGTGSARLLIAGLQRAGTFGSSIILVDELEHGLEPHRIARLLNSLGAKEADPPLQVFITTHSPAAVRELSTSQLFVTRSKGENHEVLPVGSHDQLQGTIRKFPEALLAPLILVCEGATEVGFIRGLDRRRVEAHHASIEAFGVALVDSGGITELYKRALAFQSLGYTVAVLRDDDRQPDLEQERSFIEKGGTRFSWSTGLAIEDAIVFAVTEIAIAALLDIAEENLGEQVVASQISSEPSGHLTLAAVRREIASGSGVSPQVRQVISKAARCKNNWFKTVSRMERVAYDVVSLDLPNADENFVTTVESVFAWCARARA